MTPDQARQVAERIGNAKKQLMEALAIAEQSSSAKIACQIGTLCGKAEALQHKVSAMTTPKKPTMRQFIRDNRL